MDSSDYDIPCIPQYQDIIYSPEYICPCCGMSGFNSIYNNPMLKGAPNLVGYADTEVGFQIVVQCPYCWEKYRFHSSRSRSKDVALEALVKRFGKHCPNIEEFKKK